MTVLGVDYAWGHPQPVHIAAAGYQFVMRYLSNDSGKNLTAAEAKALLAAGLDIGMVWETTANRAMSGAAGGAADGARAKGQADMAGAPAGSAIYFAVDFDAQPAQMPTIDAYANAFASAIAPHPAGVYGGLAVCNRLLRLPYRWQTAAWSQGWRAYGVCLFQRVGQALIDGVGCDVNEQLAPFGGWLGQPAPAAPPASSPAPPSSPPVHVTVNGEPRMIQTVNVPIDTDGNGKTPTDIPVEKLSSLEAWGEGNYKGPRAIPLNDGGKVTVMVVGHTPSAPPPADPWWAPVIVTSSD